jgi:hypothetical protein
MGFHAWMCGDQDEISCRLVTEQLPQSANPVKVTLFRDGVVSVETPLGVAPTLGGWEGPFDTSMRLILHVPVYTSNTPTVTTLDLYLHMIEHTHVFMCPADHSTMLMPWKRFVPGPATFDALTRQRHS